MGSAEAGDGIITGTVVGRDGWPVPHAVITVIDALGTQSARTPVGGDGRFTVAGLAPGTYTVITAAAGHAPHAYTSLVNGAGPVELGRLVLSPVNATVPPAPGTWQIDATHSTVAVTAVHLGFARIHGRFRDFRGTLTVAEPLAHSSVEVIVEAASIYTDNHDRDIHLRSADFLDVVVFPHIRYTGHGLTVLNPDTWQLKGKLTLKGHTEPIPLDVNYLGTGPGSQGEIRAGFHASTQLDRDQFGMVWNQSLFTGRYAVGRTLRVAIDIEAVYQRP